MRLALREAAQYGCRCLNKLRFGFVERMRAQGLRCIFDGNHVSLLWQKRRLSCVCKGPSGVYIGRVASPLDGTLDSPLLCTRHIKGYHAAATSLLGPYIILYTYPRIDYSLYQEGLHRAPLIGAPQKPPTQREHYRPPTTNPVKYSHMPLGR